MNKTKKIEHVLKGWEKKYGYLGISLCERDFFSSIIGKRFTLNFLGKELRERKIDVTPSNGWRIWVSHGSLKNLQVGYVLVFYRDEKENYYAEKKGN